MIATLKITEDQQVKVKGSLYGVEKGEKIIANGKWEFHPKYGRQFAIEHWERPIPNTRDQVIAFLSSPLVKGCSAKQAVIIADKFGENAIEIINELGENAVNDIRGIGKKRASQIVGSIRSTFEIQKIISYLLNYGITANMAMKAYKHFGSDTLSILTKNPYKLIELRLVSFLKADEIARKMGIMPLSTFRIDSCLEFVLKKICFDFGHCYVHEDELYSEVLRALNHNALNDQKVELQDIQQSIYRLEDKTIIIENNCVYPKFLYKYEDKLAEKLSQMKGSAGGEALPFLNSLIVN